MQNRKKYRFEIFLDENPVVTAVLAVLAAVMWAAIWYGCAARF